MAIIRMINGLTSTFQNGVYAMSISQICDRIGLPADMVEYRHKASHNQLPSLSELRKCADDALIWLKRNYWESQAKQCNMEAVLKTQLKEYKNLQKTILFEPKGNVSQNALYSKKKKALLTIKEAITPSHINTLLVPYIVDKVLIPRNKKIVRTKYKELPRRLKKIWFDMIKIFTRTWPSFLPCLLLFITDRLLKKSMQEDCVEGEDQTEIQFEVSILKCWFSQLLNSFYINPTIMKETSKDEEDDDEEELSLPSKEIMHLCFNNMCKASVKIIKKTMMAVKSDKEREAMVPKLKELFHYKSRAMTLLDDEKLLNDGKCEKSSKKRGFGEINQTEELDLDQFEILLNQINNQKAAPSGWEECVEDLPPGIGLQKDGSAPNHLELPKDLDSFSVGSFYLTKKDCESFGYEYEVTF